MSNPDFYKNAKIYKIVDNTTGKLYVGSTCKLLCQRLALHRSNYRRYVAGKGENYVTSFEILKNNDYSIILLEQCEGIENKEQMRARERYYIETLDCVNKIIVGRTRKEYREAHKEEIQERNKQYREAHKEAIQQKGKQYYQDNKEKKQENMKQYYQNNKEQLLEHQNQYYQEHKEQINERKKMKYTCGVCKCEIRLQHKLRHEKTTKHQNNLKANIPLV